MRQRSALTLAATVAVVAATGLQPAPAGAAPGAVRMVDLGDLGRPWTYATGMNERGDVIGQGDTGDGFVHLFRWRDGVMRDLGVRGDVFVTNATDIDDAGRVVGMYAHGGGATGFLWEDGRLTTLPFQPRHINNRGQIVGGAQSGGVSIWRAGAVSDITPPGTTSANPVALNDRGQVLFNVVRAGAPAGVTGAVLWHEGAFTDLGTLGGGHTAAWAMNELGWVTGGSQDAAGVTRPFLWRGGTMRRLGEPDAPAGEGLAVDLRGAVAGRVAIPGGWSSRPVVWQGQRTIDVGAPDLAGEAGLVDGRGGVYGLTLAPSGGEQPFRWRGGVTTVLPCPEGSTNCRPVAVDRAGTRVTGNVFTGTHWRAVTWTVR